MKFAVPSIICLVFLALSACNQGGPATTPPATAPPATAPPATAPLTTAPPTTAPPTTAPPATTSPPAEADIPEPSVRKFLALIAQAGPGEVVPGFGGIFLDAKDKSIVHVYMLDTSHQEAAEQAARIILPESLLKGVTEVRVRQGDYSWGQLLAWYLEAQDVAWQVKGVWSSGIDESQNRISFGVRSSYSAEQVREALAETGVPDKAVVFRVAPKQALDDPPVQTGSPIGVSISLEFEETVPKGQHVSIEVVLTNESDETVEFEHGIPFHENVMIFTPKGDQVWAKIRGGVQVGTGGSTRLQPGEQIRTETLWDQRDQDGFELPAGRYLVRGTIRINDYVGGFYRAMDLATGPYELVIDPKLMPTPTPRPLLPGKMCGPEIAGLPCGPGVEIGKTYSFTLYTHCGVRRSYFDGRRWIVGPTLSNNDINPPPGWGNPTDEGTMELVAKNVARYTSRSGLVAEFRPLPEGEDDVWSCS